MKLVADCIEGMLSARATRFTDALLLGALQVLLSDLGAHDDGEASTIVLPHVLRWNGDAARPVLDRVAGGLGAGDTDGLIARIEQTSAALGLPARLRQVWIETSSLDAIAQNASVEASARSNVRPADAVGLREILDLAH